MRRNIVHPWASQLSYEIRQIVEDAMYIQSFWIDIIWENIWDPIQKWEKIPSWFKNIVKNAIYIDDIYWYSPTKGLEKTREYIASKSNWKISKEDIIFFNGIGDAINKVYKSLPMDARIIWPNPAYPTHSSAEAAHAWTEHITYRLDPDNNFNPDLEDLENKVKYNPNIAWILVINPDNPTWAVFPKDVLISIVNIAKKYNLFLIFDEIYENLVFDDNEKISLSEIVDDVPAISMKWISKDLPWPGARCWRIEVYNSDKDLDFQKYIRSILNSKMLEVCSTTLPQYVLPQIYESSEFKDYLNQRIRKYKERANIAQEIFSDLPMIKFVKPKGAFYLSVIFKEEYFSENANLPIKNERVRDFIESKLFNKKLDQKFVYWLLGSTGICVVPLTSWFNSYYPWFRMTLLEEDIDKFKNIVQTIKDAIIYFSNWN